MFQGDRPPNGMLETCRPLQGTEGAAARSRGHRLKTSLCRYALSSDSGPPPSTAKYRDHNGPKHAES